MRPAKTVGGDFYDYCLQGERLSVLIADVSDKGLPAAMFMMRAKNTLRAVLQNSGSLEKAISAANAALCADNPGDMFITLFVACVNVRTGVGKCISCGHLPPFLRHGDGSVSAPECEPNLPLGLFEDAAFSARPLRLLPADTIFLYTDGLTDAQNAAGEAFGTERLRETLRTTPRDAQDLPEAVCRTIDSFTGGAVQYDDMTALSLRFDSAETPEIRSVRLPADPDASEKAVVFVNAMLESAGCPENVRRDTDVVIDELCSNLADYAYPDGTGFFVLTAETGANYIGLTFADSGVPFDPLGGDAPETDGEPLIGGLGIHLVRHLTDELSYAREDGENRLRLLRIW